MCKRISKGINNASIYMGIYKEEKVLVYKPAYMV